MREAATFTLGRSGDRRAVAALLKALADRRPSVQTLACLGLAQIDDPRVAPVLISTLADARKEDATRAACAYAIGSRRAASGIPALLGALVDNRGEAQRLAAWSLGQLGDGKTLGPLIRAYFSRAGRSSDELVWGDRSRQRRRARPRAARPARRLSAAQQQVRSERGGRGAAGRAAQATDAGQARRRSRRRHLEGPARRARRTSRRRGIGARRFSMLAGAALARCAIAGEQRCEDVRGAREDRRRDSHRRSPRSSRARTRRCARSRCRSSPSSMAASSTAPTRRSRRRSPIRPTRSARRR